MRKTKSFKSRTQANKIPVAFAEAEAGLSSAEAKARADAGLANTPVSPPSKSVGQIIFTNIFTYFNMLFCALAFCLALVGAWLDMGFLGVVFINTIVGIVQELRSKSKLDKLTILAAPKAAVIRDGAEISLPVDDAVRDDIAVFRAGEQIYADAVVVAGGCRVNESLVTGEADEIDKKPGDGLYSGSFVISGECRARLTAVGAESFASKLTLEAKRTGRVKKSEMMRSLSRLVAFIGVIAIPFGAALLYKEINVIGKTWQQAVIPSVAALVGMIPEGLYLLTSLALVAGVLRLSKKRTLVHEMACIETLARVDVLCVDKTGTITEDKMTVEGIRPLESGEAEARGIMVDYCAAVRAENDTMRALAEYFRGEACRRAADVLPFSSSFKYGGVEFAGGEVALLGAPEVLLGERYAEFSAAAVECARGGRRVLLLAKYRGALGDAALGADYINRAELIPCAFVILSNKIRADAPETFSWFAAQGVAVKVISGDNPVTVSEVADAAGIPGARLAVDARTLTTDEAITDAAEKYTVFGRVTPEQKKKLVIALKKAGHTVAMTGDGVNDVLALREADCSVAMASGSAAAGQVANIVLLGSDFSAMPSVVAEGRRVINNIERSASLYLVKNIFSFALALMTLFCSLPYPFSPSQLTLVNMMTIGIPSFILAMEPNESRVRGHFMSNVVTRALPAATADFVLVVGVLVFYGAFDWNAAALGAISTFLMGVVGLQMVDRVCRPYGKNAIRITLMILMTVFFFAGFFVMHRYILRVDIHPEDALLTAVLALVAGRALDFFSRWLRRARDAVKDLRRMIKSLKDRA